MFRKQRRFKKERSDTVYKCREGCKMACFRDPSRLELVRHVQYAAIVAMSRHGGVVVVESCMS